MIEVPVALTIAGSDSGGGAGIQADLRAFAAFGVHGASAVTALTAQSPREVAGIRAVEPGFVVLQARTVLDAMPVRAIKTGMLGSAAIAAAVADLLAGLRGVAIVVDPVMVATVGARLLDEDAVDVLRRRLLPLALVVTPNLPEAAALLGEDADAAGGWTRSRREEAARAILALGPRSVLLKGGHASDATASDLLVARDEGKPLWLDAPRVPSASTHGTGCMLSAAIAAGLALGWSVERSARAAKAFLTDALRRGLRVPPPPFGSRRVSE